MAAALEQEPECQAEAARRKRVSVGSAQGVDIGCRCRTAGPDLEGDACEAAQAADSNQQERAFAFFCTTRHHSKKKPASRGTTTRGGRPRAPTLDARARHA